MALGREGKRGIRVLRKIGGVISCRRRVSFSLWWLFARSTGTGLLFLPGGASNRETSGCKRETL
jgi:hypothetical protein